MLLRLTSYVHFLNHIFPKMRYKYKYRTLLLNVNKNNFKFPSDTPTRREPLIPATSWHTFVHPSDTCAHTSSTHITLSNSQNSSSHREFWIFFPSYDTRREPLFPPRTCWHTLEHTHSNTNRTHSFTHTSEDSFTHTSDTHCCPCDSQNSPSRIEFFFSLPSYSHIYLKHSHTRVILACDTHIWYTHLIHTSDTHICFDSFHRKFYTPEIHQIENSDSRYKFKLDRIFNLNLYRNIPRNLSFLQTSHTHICRAHTELHTEKVDDDEDDSWIEEWDRKYGNTVAPGPIPFSSWSHKSYTHIWYDAQLMHISVGNHSTDSRSRSAFMSRHFGTFKNFVFLHRKTGFSPILICSHSFDSACVVLKTSCLMRCKEENGRQDSPC